MFLDQRMATLHPPQLHVPIQHDRLTELKGAGGRRDSALGGKFSIGSADQPGFMVAKIGLILLFIYS
jgi:hypothetical protein